MSEAALVSAPVSIFSPSAASAVTDRSSTPGEQSVPTAAADGGGRQGLARRLRYRRSVTILPGTMSDIEIQIGQEPKTMRGYLAAPNDGAKHAAVVVLHELFGVNPDIRGVVDRLATLGYVAVAPQMYYRDTAPGQWLARDAEGRRRGFEHLNRLDRDAVVRLVASTMQALKERDDVDGSRIGALGFSAGGHMAFYAATALPLLATAVLYPGWLTGGDVTIAKGTPTIDRAPMLAERGGRLFFAVGGKDAIIVPDQVAEIRAKLDAAKVDVELVVYPNAAHAFFWEGTPSFEPESVADAWRRIEAFFARSLAS